MIKISSISLFWRHHGAIRNSFDGDEEALFDTQRHLSLEFEPGPKAREWHETDWPTIDLMGQLRAEKSDAEAISTSSFRVGDKLTYAIYKAELGAREELFWRLFRSGAGKFQMKHPGIHGFIWQFPISPPCSPRNFLAVWNQPEVLPNLAKFVRFFLNQPVPAIGKNWVFTAHVIVDPTAVISGDIPVPSDVSGLPGQFVARALSAARNFAAKKSI